MNTFVFPIDSAEATLDKVGGKGTNLGCPLSSLLAG